MKIRNIISALTAGVVAAAGFAMTASAADTYTAAITFQSVTYVFRNTLSQDAVLYWDNDLGEAAEFEGASFTDATITGDGTYTVEVSGVNDGGWNMLKLDTTLDSTVTPDVAITITGVEVNGEAIDFDAEAAAMVEDEGSTLVSDQYSAYEFNISGPVRAQLINVYDKVAAIPNEGYDSVKITFDVTGLDAASGSDSTDGTGASSDETTTTTTPDKTSPETGVEGIAVVAGAAIAAGGVMLLSKKRK